MYKEVEKYLRLKRKLIILEYAREVCILIGPALLLTWIGAQIDE